MEKICDTELSNIMGMKHSGICRFAHIDPSLACLTQSSSLWEIRVVQKRERGCKCKFHFFFFFFKFSMDVQDKLKHFKIIKAR